MKGIQTQILLHSQSEITFNQKKYHSKSLEKLHKDKFQMENEEAGSPYEKDDFIIEETSINDEEIQKKQSQKFLENQLIKKSELNGLNVNIFYTDNKKRSYSKTQIKQSFESQFSIQGKIKVDSNIKIYSCKKFMNNQMKLAKIYTNPEYQFDEHIQNELNILSLLSKYPSKYLVKLEQIIYQQDQLCIITDGCSGITLKQLIQSKQQLRFDQIQKMIKQILKGIRHMHGLGIVHRNLNSEIIHFLDKGNYKKLKIVDFTYAREFKQNQNIIIPKQDIYQALELQDQYSQVEESADIYSVGIILAQLLLKDKFPDYENDCNLNVKNDNFYKNIINLVKQIESQVSRNLILQMISIIPQLRPNAQECLNNIFFNLSQLEEESIFSEDENIQSPSFPAFKNPFFQ